jgi:hypothetical protein
MVTHMARGFITLTKHPQSLDTTAASRELREAGAPEIQLSEEAISAGLSVLLESGALYYQTESHRPLVEDILRESLRAAGYYLRVS